MCPWNGGMDGVAWMQDGRTDVYIHDTYAYAVRINEHIMTMTHSMRCSVTRQNGHWRRHCSTPLELYNEDDESPITMFAGVC